MSARVGDWTPNTDRAERAAKDKGTIDEQRKDIEADKQFSLDMFRLQQQAHRNNQEITTKANIEKAKHDAVMNIANNIK